jgi:hypothetical protein
MDEIHPRVSIMSAIELRRTPEELAQLGAEIYDKQVRPTLQTEDDDKFVAIDVLSGEFEIDDDDYSAVLKLRGRRPSAEIWLGCIGQPATYRMRSNQ